jgi:hypothetical protein
MRPEPPSGLPTVNSGLPWSAEDIADLQIFLQQGIAIDAIAKFLWRKPSEVKAKVVELRGH